MPPLRVGAPVWRVASADPAGFHLLMSTGRVRFSGFNERGDVVVSRNHLPHWSQAGCTYFITFHLGDSLPATKLGDWRQQRAIWLELHPQPWSREVEAEYETRFAHRIDAWLDAGEGDCPLRRPEIRRDVERCLLRFDDQRHDLDAFVIMPNHVHALITPRRGVHLFELLKGIKGTSARICNALLGQTGATFWMEDSYNRIVRDAEELQAFRRYIATNPEKANLASDEFTLALLNVLIV